jgi:hypothetical protein
MLDIAKVLGDKMLIIKRIHGVPFPCLARPWIAMLMFLTGSLFY